MNNRPRIIAGFLLLAAGSLLSCSRVPPAPKPIFQPTGSSMGAYETVKMGRYGGRMGPTYFAHTLHADLPSLDGGTIACSWCHLEKCGPPRRCGECHVGRRRGQPRPKLPTT